MLLAKMNLILPYPASSFQLETRFRAGIKQNQIFSHNMQFGKWNVPCMQMISRGIQQNLNQANET